MAKKNETQKKNPPHTVRTVLKYSRQIVETESKSIHVTHLHDHSLYWLGTVYWTVAV